MVYSWRNECLNYTLGKTVVSGAKNALKTLNTILKFYARNDFCTDN